MLPVLLRIGPLTLYSFGAMVALAFLAAEWIAQGEWRRRGLDCERLSWAPAVALVAGLFGAKAYFLLEHPPTSWHDAFSLSTLSGGLTWYGGLIAGAAAVALVIVRSRQPFLSVADGAAPALAAAYGIGRIGCLLAGDGDYGPPSDLPWAMAFPRGTVPTSVRVHPTPAYEALAMAALFILLRGLRGRVRTGRLFALYMILGGLERFGSEFVRTNPPVLLGLTEAQCWSAAVIVGGGALWALAPSRRQRGPASQMKRSARAGARGERPAPSSGA
jgi:phosphatidylglycerol:prolipoprotein diacylglycerol transferase